MDRPAAMPGAPKNVSMCGSYVNISIEIYYVLQLADTKSTDLSIYETK